MTRADVGGIDAPHRRWLTPLLLVLVGLVAMAGACSAGATDDDAGRAVDNDSATESTIVEPPPEETAATTTDDDGAAAEDKGASDETDRDADFEQPDDAASPALTDPTASVVYDGDFGASIAPIFATRCASCHQPGGPGAGHFEIDTADDVASNTEWIWTYVEPGLMPPWPAGPLSVAFDDDRSLSDDELTAIADWIADGAPLDVPADTPIRPPKNFIELDRVDATVRPQESYQGSPSQVDAYRCMIYDPEITEGTWLTGYKFVPDQTEVVHHAIGYLVSGNEWSDALAHADEDAAGGYECFGDSGLRSDMLIGWAPGQAPSVLPEGSGVFLEPGDFFVVQIHYHYEDEGGPDASWLEFQYGDPDDELAEIEIAQYVAPAEIPCSSDESGPLCDRDAAYDDAVARFGHEGVLADGINQLCRASPSDFAHMVTGVAASRCDLPVYGFGEIISILGHQHEIGRSFRMTLNPGEASERILLDIPDWDFDWQYNYEPVESIVLRPGDRIRIECSWDRARQEPGVEPRYILWADGTNDEMCFSTIVTRFLD